MGGLIVKGGRQLFGEIQASGAKNAALPILVATLLSEDAVTLYNVPQLQDVRTTLELLRVIGAEVVVGTDSITIDTARVKNFVAPYELVSKMRASILVLGPLLGRFGQANVSLPGGCAIGARPVDQHLKGMEALGASIDMRHGYIEAKVPGGRLQGAEITNDLITVTGTENILMATVLAKGRSVIRNAAREPEVNDLAHFLNRLGAKITGIGSDTLVVEGVEKLNGGEYRVMPDRIEAGTYLAAGIITRGAVRVSQVVPDTMSAVLDKFALAGAKVGIGADWVEVDMQGKRAYAVDVETAPYPGVPTDMQAQFLAMNSLASGSATIVENIFENRFMHVQELNRLGANITINGNSVVVKGVLKLTGARVVATDLRASAGLVLAALMAEGESLIDEIQHIDRGYEAIEEKLTRLGATVYRQAGMATKEVQPTVTAVKEVMIGVPSSAEAAKYIVDEAGR